MFVEDRTRTCVLVQKPYETHYTCDFTLNIYQTFIFSHNLVSQNVYKKKHFLCKKKHPFIWLQNQILGLN